MLSCCGILCNLNKTPLTLLQSVHDQRSISVLATNELVPYLWFHSHLHRRILCLELPNNSLTANFLGRPLERIWKKRLKILDPRFVYLFDGICHGIRLGTIMLHDCLLDLQRFSCQTFVSILDLSRTIIRRFALLCNYPVGGESSLRPTPILLLLLLCLYECILDCDSVLDYKGKWFRDYQRAGYSQVGFGKETTINKLLA